MGLIRQLADSEWEEVFPHRCGRRKKAGGSKLPRYLLAGEEPPPYIILDSGFRRNDNCRAVVSPHPTAV